MGHGSRGMWSERGTLTAVWTKETRREQEMEGDEGAECMRTREGSVCHSACPSKRALSTASLWGCPHQSHHLAAASIDHLQSFIPPIKMLSVHITFVFLCWTLLLLHKDTVFKKSDYKHGLFLKSGRNRNIVFCFRVLCLSLTLFGCILFTAPDETAVKLAADFHTKCWDKRFESHMTGFQSTVCFHLLRDPPPQPKQCILSA